MFHADRLNQFVENPRADGNLFWSARAIAIAMGSFLVA